MSTILIEIYHIIDLELLLNNHFDTILIEAKQQQHVVRYT